MLVRKTKNVTQKRKMLSVRSYLHHIQSGESLELTYLLPWRNKLHGAYQAYINTPPEGYDMRKVLEVTEVWVTFEMPAEEFYIQEHIVKVVATSGKNRPNPEVDSCVVSDI